MNEFATLAFILSFPGMVLTVSMLTQVSKRLVDKVFSIQTQYVVYIYSLVLCVVAALTKGDFTTLASGAETALVWFVNSAVIWLSAMKAFEKVKKPTDGDIQIDSTNKEKDVVTFSFKDETPVFKDGKVFKMKVDMKDE